MEKGYHFLHHSLKRIITSGQVLPWQFQVVHVYCSIKYEQTQHLDLIFVPEIVLHAIFHFLDINGLGGIFCY